MFPTAVVPQQSIAGVISVTLPQFAAAVAVLQVNGLQIVTPRFHVKHCRGNRRPPRPPRSPLRARRSSRSAAGGGRGKGRGVPSDGRGYALEALKVCAVFPARRPGRRACRGVPPASAPAPPRTSHHFGARLAASVPPASRAPPVPSAPRPRSPAGVWRPLSSPPRRRGTAALSSAAAAFGGSGGGGAPRRPLRAFPPAPPCLRRSLSGRAAAVWGQWRRTSRRRCP